jgi:hypothetical protein
MNVAFEKLCKDTAFSEFCKKKFTANKIFFIHHLYPDKN